MTVGSRIAVTDPNGNTTTFAYDGMRRLTQVTPPAPFQSNITTTSYDLDGRPTSVSQATGNASTPFRTTTTSYNAAGKPLVVTNPDGTTTTAAYDTVRRPSTVTSSSGRQVAFAYDAASRVTQITDQVGGTLDPSITVNLGAVVRQRMTYNAASQIATLADGNGNTLTYAYDEFDRPSQLNYPDGSHELSGYDANGNKIGFKTRSTAAISFAYDAMQHRQRALRLRLRQRRPRHQREPPRCRRHRCLVSRCQRQPHHAGLAGERRASLFHELRL
jgi:YD repeat-containing protein